MSSAPYESEFYLVVERWEGDDGLVVAGPCSEDELEDAREEREAEADDYSVMGVTHEALSLFEIGGGEIETAEGVEW